LADLETNRNGVKSNNCFSELRFFDLICSQPPDLMHDFLEGTLVYNLKCLLEDLEMFVAHYPSKNITAKQHFMTHYGNAIRQFGPPYSYSTMRFRHQRVQLFYLMSPNYVVDSIIGSHSNDTDVEVVEA